MTSITPGLTFDSSTFTTPINNVITEISNIATQVEQLGQSVTTDVMNQVNSALPISDFLTMINGISSSIRTVIESSIPNMVTQLNTMKGSVDGILGNINSIDLSQLNTIITNPANCKLPICNILSTFESLMDLDQCDTETCKIVRSIRNIITTGSTEGCEIGACNWLNQISNIVNDPTTCTLPICTMISGIISGNTLSGYVTGWIDTIFKDIQWYLIAGVVGFGSIILLMFLMLLILVFK